MELDIYKIISKYHVGGYQVHRDFWMQELQQFHVNPIVDKVS